MYSSWVLFWFLWRTYHFNNWWDFRCNHSYFIGDDKKRYNIFGEDGVRKTAEEFEKDFLGEIPINPKVGEAGDNGKPIVEENPNHEISKIYLEFANKIKSTYL